LSRKKAVAGGLGVLSAALVAGAVLTPAAGATEVQPQAKVTKSGGSGIDSAFAVSASGLLKVNPTPSVDDSDGYAEASLAELKVPALADLRVLTARAGSGQARASVADLSVGLGLGRPALTASAVEAQCGAKTSSSLAQAKLGTVPLDVQAPPNTAVAVPGLLSVVLNKQVTHQDGAVTVTAISINVDGIQKLDLATATCTPGAGDNGGTTSSSKPVSSPSPVGGKAPTPTPVKAHLDVTG
jgi:hypothetical protein